MIESYETRIASTEKLVTTAQELGTKLDEHWDKIVKETMQAAGVADLNMLPGAVKSLIAENSGLRNDVRQAESAFESRVVQQVTHEFKIKRLEIELKAARDALDYAGIMVGGLAVELRDAKAQAKART